MGGSEGNEGLCSSLQPVACTSCYYFIPLPCLSSMQQQMAAERTVHFLLIPLLNSAGASEAS